MRGKSTIIFDLDGTLTDPKEGITKSVQYALRHFGIRVDNLDSLTGYIGPPLRRSFQELHGLRPEQAQQAVAEYRIYFERQGIFENAVFPGVEGVLAALRERHKRLLIATTKPTLYAEKILAHFGILEYFAFISGAQMNGERSEKPDLLRHAFAQAGGEDMSSCVMIGDRAHDMLGAKAVGIDSIGVLYGYGSRQELMEAGASALAQSVEALHGLLLG